MQFDAFATNLSGVQTVTIGSTTTDANGNYSLPVPTAAQLAPLASVDAGTINYEVITTGDSAGVQQFADSTFPASQLTASGSIAQAKSAAFVKAQGNLNLHLTPVRHKDGTLVRAASVAPRDCINNSGSWTTTGNGTYQVITGELHDYINMYGQYTYQDGSSTTIGVAISTNGGSTFSESGSASVTASGQSAYSDSFGLHTGMYVYMPFYYAKQVYHTVCGGGADGEIRVIALGWEGGASPSGNLTQYDGSNSPIWKSDWANSRYYTYYKVYSTGTVTFSRTAGSGGDYSAGVNFAGIGLTAETNFSTSVTYQWTMDNNTVNPHYLFGSNGWPAYSTNIPSASIIYSN